jgi:hypothetical protein
MFWSSSVTKTIRRVVFEWLCTLLLSPAVLFRLSVRIYEDWRELVLYYAFNLYLLMVPSLGFGAEPQEEGCERSELLIQAARSAGRSERSERRVGAAYGGLETVSFGLLRLLGEVAHKGKRNK